jgi:hypothetical protein
VTLDDLLAATAAELAGVVRNDDPGGTEWQRGGRVFAVTSGSAAEFRLDGPIAAAALRTPDTGASPRGPEWVLFAPAALDDHAIDRAGAWFAAAWRRAGG